MTNFLKLFNILLPRWMGVVLLLIVLLPACREKYYPELEETQDLLVVEALFTDMEQPHYVFLSRSWQFGQGPAWNPETDAKVWLTSLKGDSIVFTEQSPGRYYTTPNQRAEANNQYTLHIHTSDGERYHSASQALPGMVSIDSLYSRPESMSLLYDMGTGNQSLDLKVVSVLADIGAGENAHTRVRFVNELMLLWQIRVGPMEDIQRYYHWLSRDITHFMTSRLAVQDVSNPLVVQQQLAFFPFHRSYLKMFGFPDETEFNSARIIKTRVYSLNEDATRYYQLKEKQLAAEGQLFDPLDVELWGNIRHVEGKERVLGFFEVSNEGRFSYNVKIPSANVPQSAIDEMDDLSHLPSSGYFFNEVPPFWIF